MYIKIIDINEFKKAGFIEIVILNKKRYYKKLTNGFNLRILDSKIILTQETKTDVILYKYDEIPVDIKPIVVGELNNLQNNGAIIKAMSLEMLEYISSNISDSRSSTW